MIPILVAQGSIFSPAGLQAQGATAAHGLFATEVISDDYDADGSIDVTITTTNVYDSQHRLINGVWESPGSRQESRYAYNARGEIVTLIFEDGDPSSVASRQTWTYTYNARGNVVLEVGEDDADADGHANHLYIWRYIYNAQGRLAQGIREIDAGNDGSIDSGGKATLEYDSVGRILLQCEELFDSAGAIVSRVSIQSTYDAQGNRVREVVESDLDGDGPGGVTRETGISIYGPGGRLLRATIDGQHVVVYTYDTRGNLLITDSAHDYDANGTVDTRDKTTNSYDSASRLIRVVQEQDYDGDGVVDYRGVRSSAYSAQGLLTADFLEADADGDGSGGITLRSNTSRSYSLSGNLLKTVYEEDGDGDGPSPINWREVTAYTY